MYPLLNYKLYPTLNFLAEEQLPLVITGEKRQVTLKDVHVKSGDILKTVFGRAKVTSIIHYYENSRIGFLKDSIRERWAVNEGFTNYKEADEWFKLHYGEDWANQNMIAIKFDGDWLEA